MYKITLGTLGLLGKSPGVICILTDRPAEIKTFFFKKSL